MCTTPNTLADGKVVACHKCEQCRDQAIDDWVGRNIAEMKVSDESFFITLTYGRNQDGDSLHERSVLLTYHDPQLYFKLLRRHGFKVRYMIAGEYGTKTQRSHWHAIVHFKGAVPIHTITPPAKKGYRFWHEAFKPDGTEIWGTGENAGVRTMWWPWGHCVWKKATPENIRYCCEYVLKDKYDERAQSKLVMSKNPPIGSEWAGREAQRYVDQYVAIQTCDYQFPDVRYKSGQRKGRPRNYRWRGKAKEIFLEEYVRRWHETHGAVPMPYSEIVHDFLLAWGDPELATRIKKMRARIAHEKQQNIRWRRTGRKAFQWRDPPVVHDADADADPETNYERWVRENGKAGQRSKYLVLDRDEEQAIADEVKRWHLGRLNDEVERQYQLARARSDPSGDVPF